MTNYTPLKPEMFKGVPDTYAVYAIKHEPTGRVYIGSTSSVRKKLSWWCTVFNPASKRPRFPRKIFDLIIEYGRDHRQWSYYIIDALPPPGYDYHAKGDKRPEWALVKRLHQTNPAAMLNDPFPVRRYRPAEVTSRQGMQPVTHLAMHLKLKRGRPYDKQPPHSWHVDPRDITPWGSPSVPFPHYLYRSLKAMNDKNPSPAAIEGLYRVWLARVPASERAALGEWGVATGGKVPYTIDEALAVPAPRGYDVTW